MTSRLLIALCRCAACYAARVTASVVASAIAVGRRNTA
jgi:hypothetical protein